MLRLLRVRACKKDDTERGKDIELAARATPEADNRYKEIVKRLRASYNALPVKKIKCGADVRPDVQCTSPGADVETAYTALIA